jgi:hypothetical protein
VDSLHRIKIDRDLLKQLELLHEVDVYWANEYTICLSLDLPSNTYICESVILKGVEGHFTVGWVVEDFGSRKDEVFGILVKKQNEATELSFFDSIRSDNCIKVEVLTTFEEFFDTRENKIVEIEIDQGIIFNRCLYIGRYDYPRSLIITSSPEYIKRVKEESVQGIRIGKW